MFIRTPLATFKPDDETGAETTENAPASDNKELEQELATAEEAKKPENDQLAFLSALNEDDDDEEEISLDDPAVQEQEQAEQEQQVQTPEQEATTTESEPATPEADAAAAAKAPEGEQKPQAPAETTPAVAEGETAETPQAPQQQQIPTAEAITETWNKWRGETLNALTQHYSPSDDDMDKIALGGDDAREVLGRYKAEIYLDAVQASIGHIVNNLPSLIGALNEQTTAINARQAKFYDRWPQLKEHEDTVLRLGEAYRHANGQYTEAQFIEEVGAQAMVALRLPLDSAPGQQQETQQTKPFVPAPSAAPKGAAPPPTNPFEAADRELFEELPDE